MLRRKVFVLWITIVHPRLIKKNVTEFIRNILFSIEEFKGFKNWSASQAREYFARIINEESIFFDDETTMFLFERDWDLNGSYFQINTEDDEPIITRY
jgi:hypothetical protein